MKQQKAATHVEYRNASYYGLFDNYMRSGYGMVVRDNSQIVFAKWSANKINGGYVCITDKVRAMGTYFNDKLQGYNAIIQTQQPFRSIYGMFRDDKLYGNAVIINYQTVMVVRYVNGQFNELIQQKSIREKQPYYLIKETFPKQHHTLHQFLITFIRDADKNNNISTYNRYQPILKVLPNENVFYGYIDSQQSYDSNKVGSQLYGFVMEGNSMVSIGEHNQIGNLQGIGRLYYTDTIEDGLYKNGHLKGIGIKYSKSSNQYSFGQNDTKKSLDKGYGFPIKQIIEIRKQFHLRSISFYNDIVMLNLNSQIQTIVNYSFNFELESRQDRRASPRFSSFKPNNQFNQTNDKSPFKEKFNKYSKQSDQIQHYTRFRNYGKYPQTSKYYKNGDSQENMIDKERQKFDHTQDSYPRNHKQSKDKSRQKITIYKEQQHEQTPYRKNNLNQYRNNPPNNREKNTTRYSGQKDTKQFIKELQEEERRKRQDIDNLKKYQQANVYRRK